MRSRYVGDSLKLALVVVGAAGLMAMCTKVYADPVAGEVFPLRQPDGTPIEVRVWGDEFYRIVESLDGYTLARDPQSGAACYARLSTDGNELISTGVPVGAAAPAELGLEQHIRIDPASARAKIAAARAVASEVEAEARKAMELGRAPQIEPSCTGNVQGIVLLVDFSDQPWTIPPSTVDNYCNQVGYTGYGNNGSVRDYFYDVSDGNLTYINYVTPYYYRAVYPKSWYDDSSIPCCSRARTLVLEALNYLNGQGFDFSDYDSNGDGYVDAVNMFYAGTRNGPWTYGLWPHSSWISFSADGVSTGPYQMTDLGSQLRLGTFCHENGHMICFWPDLYDYGYESAGVGDFCLMCYGGSDANPVEPCAYLKYISGWSTTTLLTTPQTGLSLPAGVNVSYKFEHPTEPNEYYILENRNRSARDSSLPDSGLAIWHIDTFGSNNYEQMTPEYHYEATLVQADGDWDLEYFNNYGDSTDLWSLPGYTECTPDTYPNTNWWDGSSSGLSVTDISAPGSGMIFDFLNFSDCNNNGVPDFEDIANETSTDNNANGIPDECECAVIADSPQAEPVVAAKGRYLTFVPGSPGEQTALRVVLADLPPPFENHEGGIRWVGTPQDITEDPGSSGSTPPTFKGAALVCGDPVYVDWGAVGVVHVFSDAIVPGAVYEIDAINGACFLEAESNYSDPLIVATSAWGDLVGDCSVTPCTPPDGTVDFEDIAAVVDKFKNLPGALTKARADVAPDTPDRIINFADIPAVVEAFRGLPYPFDGPEGCP